ncbi:MAG: MBL fold metallo-hydrolase, partial [Mesotoga sp.]|nr:MBL fold metallo-hydrolase [Mesotoga sp.]
MKITVLCNDKGLEGFKSEHGISFFIELNGKKFLFDTGSTDVAVKNAEKLGIDLSEVESIIISHGHYDHLG